MSYILVGRMILCEVIDPRAYQISQIRCLLSALISLLRGQDLQSKALSYGSHNELLELVDRLVLTETIFPLLSLQRYYRVSCQSVHLYAASLWNQMSLV